MRESMLKRFFDYVKIDTQAEEDIFDRYPSTEKQKDLSRYLVEELRNLGLADAEMDEYGYVMATVSSNLSAEETAKVPVIGFISHVDTSPEVSGKDVKPVVHKNYQGGDLVLPGDSSIVIKTDENPELLRNIGNDIITSDGTTLLGADDKAGVAEIVTMVEYLLNHPEIKHGTLRLGFTPDEEVGMGTQYFDVKNFAAKYAYTMDGSTVGEIENETFNASAAVFKITGISVHPGYAKGKLVNASRILADIITAMASDPAPETTEKREGYLHPYAVEGGVEEATVKVLIRDFDREGVEAKSIRLKEIQSQIQQKYPRASVDLKISESYKNMRFKLDEVPEVTEYALEAVKRAGVTPELQLIRGGTDGAKLCYMGLPTPNIFTGGQNFHSKREWIPVQVMEKAVETMIELVQIWVEKSL